jgi:GR25 family glycosyltransferase involved in LPS biosynthesis
MINDYFDKIYCINLDRRTDRWDLCLKEFEKYGLNVERFSATDGNTENYNLGYPYDNELAGSFSHLNVIKMAKELNLNNVLILEDDVEFIENANELFDDYIKQLPKDWYGLQFGGNHVYGLQRTPSPNIAKMNRSYAIHAYALNKDSFDIVIEYMTKKINDVIKNGKSVIKESVAADYFIADLHRILNFYCFIPHLAWQKDDYSDIQKKNVNYNFLK